MWIYVKLCEADVVEIWIGTYRNSIGTASEHHGLQCSDVDQILIRCCSDLLESEPISEQIFWNRCVSRMPWPTFIFAFLEPWLGWSKTRSPETLWDTLRHSETLWDLEHLWIRGASVGRWSVSNLSQICVFGFRQFQNMLQFQFGERFQERAKGEMIKVHREVICEYLWYLCVPLNQDLPKIFTVTSCTRDVSSQKGIGYITLCQWLERLPITKQLSRHAADMQLITENERALNIQPASICILH